MNDRDADVPVKDEPESPGQDPLVTSSDQPQLCGTATCKLPSVEQFPGQWEFKTEFISQDRCRTCYSAVLNRLYTRTEHIVPVRLVWSAGASVSGLWVRALPVYAKEEWLPYPVLPCLTHRSNTLRGGKHMVRCEHPLAQYDEDNSSGRYSVRVPLGQLAADGSSWWDLQISFSCNNTCVGIDRRAMKLVMTLEAGDGRVVGRRTVGLRVCYCPKRDMQNEEHDEAALGAAATRPTMSVNGAEIERPPQELMGELEPVAVPEWAGRLALEVMRAMADEEPVSPALQYCIEHSERVLQERASQLGTPRPRSAKTPRRK